MNIINRALKSKLNLLELQQEFFKGCENPLKTKTIVSVGRPVWSANVAND